METKSAGQRSQALKVDKKHIVARLVDVNAIYFEVVYHEIGKQYDNVGFGSYYLDNVLKWFDEELELVSTEKH